MNDPIASIDRVETAFVAAKNRWTGCDWDTEFGSRKYNLNELTAKRTKLLANATSGQESKAWNDAANWLAKVESDAAEARSLATRAVAQCREQMWDLALSTIQAACKIESAHHAQLVWKPLCDLIAELAK